MLSIAAVAIMAVLCSRSAFAASNTTTNVKYLEDGVERTAAGTVYVIDDQLESSDMDKELYVVQGRPKFTTPLTFTNGTGVNIILADDAVLEVSVTSSMSGILVDPGSLTIYAQCTDRSKMGVLSADVSYDSYSRPFLVDEDITIHGGIVKVRASANGPSCALQSSNSDITVGADAVVEAAAYSENDQAQAISTNSFVSSGDVTAIAGSPRSPAWGIVANSSRPVKITGGVCRATATGGGSSSGINASGTVHVEGGWVESTPPIYLVYAGTKTHTGGALIDGDTGTVSGDTVIPAGMTATLRDGVELTFEPGAKLTVEQDAKLTVEQDAKLTVDSGATLDNKGTINNDGIIDSEGTVTGTGTVNNNGAYFHDGGGEVAGDVTLTDDRTITGTLTVKDGAKLTVEHDAKLNVEQNAKLTVDSGATLDASKGTIDNKGSVENDGVVKLPETMEPEEIKALGMTGTGTVEMGGKTYDNEGTEQAGEPEHGADASAIHAYVESTGLEVHGNKLTHESALDAINSGGGISLNGGAVATDATISALAIQSVDVVPDGYGELIFDKLSGSYLVSGDRALGVEELNIVKIISADAAQLLVPTDGAEGKSAAQLDGTFVISHDGRIVSAVDGASDDYSLVVYISDDGRLDLARTVPGHVVDPLVLVKSTGGADGDPSGGSSGGACSAGFGLAAIVALATIKRRSR